jgi:HTH-type transcriptional repressor of NAD biosynthesis genes
MNGHGLIIGKFYPPHAGHHFLIDTALAECDVVTVLVLANPAEKLSGAERAAWLRERHPAASVYWAPDPHEVDYNSPAAWGLHVRVIADTLRVLRRPVVTHVYSSEDYGDELASRLETACDIWWPGMKVEHRLVDLNRIARPISATKVRADPIGNWDYLSAPVRAGLTKRIVVCGAESSGTTTLARALAERYQTVWVPEWGRLFSEAVGLSHRWNPNDFTHIADKQNELEDDLARCAGPVMFCDTDAIATCVFYELYMKGSAPYPLLETALANSSNKALYIVTDPEGVAFEDDGYRIFPKQRQFFHERLLKLLETHGLPHLAVTGNHETRMDDAIAAIDGLLEWDL